MIKKILLAIMIAIPSMLFAQGKFGVVNTQEIVLSMPEMKEVQTQLEAASQKYQTEFDNLQAEYNKKFEEFQKMEESTPQAIKERRMQDIQDLAQKIEEFRNNATQDLNRQQQALTAPVQEKVMNALNAVGSEGNFTMIFENLMPVYTGSDVVDVTPAVKQKLGIN
ncbi:MAG: OmpH family outer membrane protein [Clostridium sp.]|nr:OmpH family outer membrane protein [Clostridium sp.]